MLNAHQDALGLPGSLVAIRDSSINANSSKARKTTAKRAAQATVAFIIGSRLKMASTKFTRTQAGSISVGTLFA